MNFGDEYKKEMLSSEETARRIREGVMAKLAQPEEPQLSVKKPMRIKRFAVIGGSIAACLVIGFTAIALRNTHIIGDILAADKTTNNAAGMAGGAAPSANRPDSIAAEGVNGMSSENNTNQAPSDDFWGDIASDIGSIGSDPTGSAPENEQGISIPAQADSEPRYPDSGESGVSQLALITFEGNGFTLTDGLTDRVTRFSPVESDDVAGTYLSPDDLRNYSLFTTAEGEEYFIMESPGVVTLLNDELLILGRYVIVE